MGHLARWAVRKPVIAIISWFVLFLVIGVLGGRFGGELKDSFELPETGPNLPGHPGVAIHGVQGLQPIAGDAKPHGFVRRDLALGDQLLGDPDRDTTRGFREFTGMDAVDKGQHEAAVALGFNRFQVFSKITLPQALRHELPVFKGEFVSMLKMTSVVGYIAIQDLTKMSDIIRSRTFDAFFPLIMAAVLYIVLAGLLTWALGYVEISVGPKRKRI